MARSNTGAATAAPNANTRADWIADVVADLKPLATIEEASGALRKSPRTLRRLIDAGRLAAIRDIERGSSRVLIPRRSIETYLRALGVAS